MPHLKMMNGNGHKTSGKIIKIQYSSIKLNLTDGYLILTQLKPKPTTRSSRSSLSQHKHHTTSTTQH